MHVNFVDVKSLTIVSYDRVSTMKSMLTGRKHSLCSLSEDLRDRLLLQINQVTENNTLSQYRTRRHARNSEAS